MSDPPKSTAAKEGLIIMPPPDKKPPAKTAALGGIATAMAPTKHTADPQPPKREEKEIYYALPGEEGD